MDCAGARAGRPISLTAQEAVHKPVDLMGVRGGS